MKIKISIGMVAIILAVSMLFATLTYEVGNTYTTVETMDCRYGQQTVMLLENTNGSYGFICKVKGYANHGGDIGSYLILTQETGTELTLEAGEVFLMQVVKPWARLELEVKNKVSGEVSAYKVERMIKK